jgi:transcriptional regulator with XRE-family HTH domain
MTLDDYRIECRWSKAEMARQAGIDASTLNRAMRGIPVSLDTARKLASAISERLGRSVQWQQFEGLNIIDQ